MHCVPHRLPPWTMDGVEILVANPRLVVASGDCRRATGETATMIADEYLEHHRHMSCATAREDVVSSSLVDDTDETLTRSHLSSGIVDERQTEVWPEFFESAQTRYGVVGGGRGFSEGSQQCDQ